MKLLVVIPFCGADLHKAGELLDWIKELGRQPENNCLLVRDCKLAPALCNPILQKAVEAFNQATMIATPFARPDESWPLGPNWMFETALRHISKNGQHHFLWLEPDTVPLTSPWLKIIEEETEKGGKPFNGHVVKPGKPDLPQEMMWGVGVYPGDAKIATELLRILMWANQKSVRKAWDVAAAGYIVPKANRSTRIYNFHGEPNLPPTFALKKGPGNPKNTLEVGKLPKPTVLFHRVKDTSLISILRGDGGPTIPQLLMAWKMNISIVKDPVTAGVPVDQPLIYHCVERHAQGTIEDEQRILKAVRSWLRIYKTGQMIPCHLWNYPRSSGPMGDPRRLPYLKDVLIEGMTRATKDSDIIVITNDDTILHPDIVGVLLEKLKQFQCCGSFRVNFDLVDDKFYEIPPDKLAEIGLPDLGRDLFAFKKSWLTKHWQDIPDFFLGEFEWDLAVTAMVRSEAGIFTTKVNLNQIQISEIPRGYVIHENHLRRWVSKEFLGSPAKKHNKDLALRYYATHGLPSLIQNV